VQIRANEKLQFLQSGACSGRVPLSRSRRRGASFSFVLSDAEMRGSRDAAWPANGVFLGQMLLHHRLLSYYCPAGIRASRAFGSRSDSIGTGQAIFAEIGCRQRRREKTRTVNSRGITTDREGTLSCLQRLIQD